MLVRLEDPGRRLADGFPTSLRASRFTPNLERGRSQQSLVKVIKIFRRDGTSAQCDARCQEAKQEKCECICGGIYHGALLDSQEELERRLEEHQDLILKRLKDADTRSTQVLLFSIASAAGIEKKNPVGGLPGEWKPAHQKEVPETENRFGKSILPSGGGET